MYYRFVCKIDGTPCIGEQNCLMAANYPHIKCPLKKPVSEKIINCSTDCPNCGSYECCDCWR